MWSVARAGFILLLSLLLMEQSRAGQQTKAPAAPAKPPQVDFKVAVWYHRDRPLETFRYQIYDVRKGEYSPAVDQWVALLRSRYTTYVVIVRDVDLAREKGASEQLKVGSVIKRDLLAAAALQGVFLGGPAARPAAPRTGLPPRPERPGTLLPLPQGDSRASYLNPSQSGRFPVPVPYPKPHP